MAVRSSQTYRAGVGAATLTMSPGRRLSVPAPSTKRIGLVAPVPPAKRSRRSATYCALSPPSVMPRKAFDALAATDQQPVVNPQGTVAFSVGEAMGTAVGGVVVVAVLPSVISPLDTIGAETPLTVSSPSAVAKAPAATSVAPATSI